MKAGKGRKSRQEDDAKLSRKLDELMKDPVKLNEYVEARVDRVVKGWRKR